MSFWPKHRISFQLLHAMRFAFFTMVTGLVNAQLPEPVEVATLGVAVAGVHAEVIITDQPTTYLTETLANVRIVKDKMVNYYSTYQNFSAQYAPFGFDQIWIFNRRKPHIQALINAITDYLSFLELLTDPAQYNSNIPRFQQSQANVDRAVHLADVMAGLKKAFMGSRDEGVFTPFLSLSMQIEYFLRLYVIGTISREELNKIVQTDTAQLNARAAYLSGHLQILREIRSRTLSNPFGNFLVEVTGFPGQIYLFDFQLAAGPDENLKEDNGLYFEHDDTKLLHQLGLLVDTDLPYTWTIQTLTSIRGRAIATQPHDTGPDFWGLSGAMRQHVVFTANAGDDVRVQFSRSWLDPHVGVINRDQKKIQMGIVNCASAQFSTLKAIALCSVLLRN